MSKNRIALKFRLFAILGVVFLMVIGMLLGALFFVRPKTSVVEKRKLTRFPKFTVSSALNGAFFKDVSTWYADTYPMRDKLIAANNKFKTRYGIETKEKMVAKVKKKADEIPVDDDTEVAELPKDVEPPKTSAVDEEVQDAVTNGLYIKDGVVYNIFYFYHEGVDRYVSLLNEAAKQLDGTTQVYSVLAPTNVILLDQDLQEKIGGSDETQALQYYASKFSDQVRFAYLPDIYKKHKDDYLFFNTDHHWTADGAYYAYKMFCKEKGIEAHPQDYFEQKTYEPFLGSFYLNLKDESLAENPDKVKVYIPKGTNECEITDTNGNVTQAKVVRDDDYDENNKYLTFLGGDYPQTKIVNEEITDDSSCVILCDSYGNAMVPFLVDHYHTVYVMDFRTAQANICGFCKENSVTDLIVLNSMKISSANTTLDRMQIDLLGQ